MQVLYNSSSTQWTINNAQSAYQSSLNFSPRGSSNRVNLPNINLGTVNSISFWCRRLDNLSYKVLGSSTGGQNDPGIFGYLGTNVAYLSFGDGVNNYSKYFQTSDPNYTLLRSDDWIHFLIVRNGNTSPNAMALYINGQAVTSFTTSPTLSNDTILNTIGAGGITGFQQGFNGDISNVSIFNSALGLSDATSLYNSGSPLSDMSSFSSLVSWWKLNNTTAGIEDSKGNNNATSVQANLAIGSVSTLNGISSGMTQANLVQSDLQTVAPYSKYALDFDASSGDYIDCGQNTNLDTGDLSASMWINKDSTSSGIQYVFNNNDGSSVAGFAFAFNSNNVYIERRTRTYRGYTGWKNIGFSSDVWHHLCITYNDTSRAFVVYLNGVNVHSSTATSSTNGPSQNITIGENSGLSGFNFDGKLSNASIWNTALTPAQVTEIYNEGLPGDLNSHSAYSNLVSWWQLGENSSFASNWICADEKGTNNGESQNMGVDALTNGVGTTANGVSSGMSEGNLVGDAPYSTANALSTNMAVTSRVTGSGNTP